MKPIWKDMWKLVLIVAACFLFGSTAFARHPKMASDLDRVDPSSTIDVIVQFRQAPTERHHAKVTGRGGQFKARLGVVKGGAYRIRRGQLESLANDPDVAYISPDRKLGGRLDVTAAAVGANIAWYSYGLTGTGIGVAILDSGISTSNDLKASTKSDIVYQQDFVGGGTDDLYGHGEHVAGIVSGNGTNSNGSSYKRTFRGIAPDANLLNFRVLDQNGGSTDSIVIAAINRAIELQSQYNIRVINISLGRPVFESYTLDPLCQAVEAAWKAGMVVVVAAGNDGRNNSAGTNGYGTVNSPANDPYVITVGAMKTMGTAQRYDDLIASYSAKGPTMIDHVVKPDIVAPGNMVVSILGSKAHLPQINPQTLIPKSYYIRYGGSTASSVYFMLNGTSMAAPVVTGAVALLLQQNPYLTPDQVKARLMKTAYKAFPTSSSTTDPATGIVYTSFYDVFTVGAGYLDIAAALADTDLASGVALSPTAVFDPATGTASLIFADKSIWNAQTLWASRSVWGAAQFLDGTQTLWASQSVWASQSIWCTQSVWAQSAEAAADAVQSQSVLMLGEPEERPIDPEP